LRGYRDYLATIPDELTTIVNPRKAPPAPFVPAHLHGQPAVVIAVCYVGCLTVGGAQEDLRSNESVPPQPEH
jgi:hypothetical protein